jgi:hypothetical protein
MLRAAPDQFGDVTYSERGDPLTRKRGLFYAAGCGL